MKQYEIELPKEIKGYFKLFNIVDLWDTFTEKEKYELVKISDDWYYHDSNINYAEIDDDEFEDENDETVVSELSEGKKTPTKIEPNILSTSSPFDDEPEYEEGVTYLENLDSENIGIISLFDGDIKLTSKTVLSFFKELIGHVVAYNDYSLKKKLFFRCAEIVNNSSDNLQKHDFYNYGIDNFYFERYSQSDALSIVVDLCKKDIEIYPKYINELETVLTSDNALTLGVISFYRLAIIYEKAGNYEDAISICNLAVEYGVSDYTQSGFTGRIERIEKKMAKAKMR